MKDVRTKECNRAPKLRNPVSRMPKELMRDALLKSKEKPHGISEAYSSGHSRESPTEYADRKVESAEERGIDVSVRVISEAGRIMVKESYEKVRRYSQEPSVAENVRETAEGCAGNPVNGSTKDSAKDHIKEKVRGKRIQEKPDFHEISDEIRPSHGDIFHTGFKDDSRKSMKSIFYNTEDSIFHVDKIRTSSAIMSKKQIAHTAIPKKRIVSTMPKKQAQYVARASRRMAVRSARAAGEAVRPVKKTVRIAARGIMAAFKAAASSTKALTALAAAGGGLAVFLLLAVGMIGGALLFSSSQSTEPLSQEVMDYAPVIQKYAQQYGIPEYVQVIQAIMMQESRGQGNDPMQASECPFNTRYANSPNAITDSEYSIQVGIQYYAYCVQEAGCTSPQDLDKLKLSLQGYNYGNGYISWALRNYGRYSEANALQFSQEQAASHGWSGYGDPEYVSHVIRYYSGGNLFVGLFGNSQMVSVAMAQVGNEGGQKFWSWYGFSGRVEWCACFVSWCADECGLITSGAVPKFASCPAGVEWFRNNGKWKDNNYKPEAGIIIFFDWDRNGVSDHVGIVEKCENGRVYTIEGNSGDAVRQEIYLDNSVSILGYGII